MVSEGVAIVPPLYSKLLLVSMTFSSSSHTSDVTEGTALMVQGMVRDSVSEAVSSSVLPVLIFGISGRKTGGIRMR